ncbi:DNA mismatch repair endonuclease MutL [Aureitalea marina]|uniref:DNA mismatch repair protein MutL n=1 Tax=Aureitalea marina TaxID=930804 RepID=A0A2S7KQ01_9FLAO|nr:DNA mismatch repair endonuclease MutL [Aureitalea marina]PQB04695.1 DNA mismatch repair protein MutL [Aureitalea marina]
MADIITLLPDHVANQIAAGEVVQRPASVVKELMENAIDAGATQVQLVVKDAGKTLIQLIDNGCGMSKADAQLSFSRHATSKIKEADDLFSLSTKGFRGEALASIAAIAQVEMRTRRPEDELAIQIRISGGEMEAAEAVTGPVGTTISVKNLFYNIPARRNFLKSDAVEQRHILDEFHRVALAHPKVHFKLISNGNDLFNLPSANLRKRIVGIFGPKTNEKLVPLEEKTEIVCISGFVLKPEYARKSRGEQFFFVNDRFIKSAYLNHAVGMAFEGIVKEGAHPGFFIFLEVDPNAIDINIHPTKTEIKFEDEHAIYAMLRSTIRHSLGQYRVAASLDFDHSLDLNPSYESTKQVPVSPKIEVDRHFNPFSEKEGKAGYSSGKPPKPEVKWESLYSGTAISDPQGFHDPAEFPLEESEELESRLFDQDTVESKQETFQVGAKYIACRIRNGMIMLHQARAHQRILYESYLSRLTMERGGSQQLLFPVKIEYDNKQLTLLEDIREGLEQMGFEFADWHSDGISIQALPAEMEEVQVERVLGQLIDDLDQELPELGYSINDRMARSLAASMAIRTGTILEAEEREQLVHELFACKEPDRAPDGRPVLITLDNKFFDKQFS